VTRQSRAAGLLRVRSRRGAYVLLVVLTLVWGLNWIAMKLALRDADPIVLNLQRSVLAVVVLFGAMLAAGTPLRPPSWRAVAITALFQTTINFGSTTMALATGGAGRTSVLVFAMPFWTLLLAWPVLHERVRGLQWVAIGLALAGLVLVVDPWHWAGDLTAKGWAILSGFGWAVGTICMKYFQRDRKFDVLNFIAWQMLVGTIPFLLLPAIHDYPPTRWSVAHVLLLVHIGVVSTALGFLVWIEILRWLPAGTASLNLFAIPVVALLSSMAVFGERLSASEWAGIACIGAGLAVLCVLALREPARTGEVVVTGEGG
jgi:drug/metabolite transporter (DMT)-like permease